MNQAQAKQWEIVPHTPGTSFAVIGDMGKHREYFTACYGVWNESRRGWVFSLKREKQIRAYLDAVETPRQAPHERKQAPQPTQKPAKRGKAKPGKQPKTAKAVVEKAESACSKERIARALAGEPVSGYHWAMRHVLESGLRPQDVSRGTGLFGRDKNGKAFGETERRAMFWLLNSKSTPIDLAICEDCPEHLRSSVDENTFWGIVSDFSGAGGKSNLVAKCIQLSENSVVLPDCPF